MPFLIYVVLLIFTLIIIVWRWVEGIDYMNKNHPDYKGYDFFDEDEDEWDNKKKL